MMKKPIILATLIVALSCKNENKTSEVKVDGELSSYKFVVSIMSSKAICSATPIARWALLTATHCIENLTNGGVHLSDDPENKSVMVFFSDRTGAQKILEGKSYKDNEHDAVILVMSKPLLGYSIARIANSEQFQKLQSYELFVAGYGASKASVDKNENLIFEGSGEQRTAKIDPATFEVGMLDSDASGTSPPESDMISFRNAQGTRDSILQGDSGSGLYAFDHPQLPPLVFGVASFGEFPTEKVDGKSVIAYTRSFFVSVQGRMFKDLIAKHMVSPVEICKDYHCIQFVTPHSAIQPIFKGISVEGFKRLWSSDISFQPGGNSIEILRSSVKHTLINLRRASLSNAIMVRFEPEIKTEEHSVYIHWTTMRDLQVQAKAEIFYKDFKGHIYVSHMNGPEPTAVIVVDE